ncbi:MAG: M50 family metallopeptidase, partial [Propionibacteriaceae bacterium]
VKRGETEYGIKLLPLGGYVRLVGMFPPSADGRLRDSSSGFAQTLADDARAQEWDDITEADHGRLFYEKKTWQKLIIMAGGITVNLILAFVLFYATFATYGISKPSLVVGAVHECVIPASRTDRTCHSGDAPTPAAVAGLRAGDRFVSFAGQPVTGYEQLSTLIRAHGAQQAQLVVVRDGHELTLDTTTMVTGLPRALDPSKIDQVGYVGFTPRYEQATLGPLETGAQMWTMSKQSLVALAQLPVKVFHVVVDMVKGRPRDPNSPMSIVGASRIAGEVAGSEQLTLADKAASGALLLGSLNLFLFWFNVIPLLPMDGGHIAGAMWEWLKRRGAKVCRRPDPGYVDTAKALPLVYVVGGLIFAMGFFLIVADLFSPVRLR